MATTTEATARTRTSVSLSGSALDAVRDIAQRHAVSEGEVVRRAIALLKFIEDETVRGTVFRMQTTDGEQERIRVVYT